jgi:hypothetical protein
LVDDDSSGIVRRRISAFVIGNLEPVLHAVPVKSSKANDHTITPPNLFCFTQLACKIIEIQLQLQMFMKIYFERVMVSIMVFNATFNNLSVIPWRSVLLVEETSVDEKTAALPQVTETLYHIMLYTSFERD